MDPSMEQEEGLDTSDVPVVVLDEQTSGDVSSEVDSSSYPCTPPPSRGEPSMISKSPAPEGLPSFNNSEMLERIKEKKSELEENDLAEIEGAQSFPFTPPNSFTDGNRFMQEQLSKNDFLKKIEGRLNDPVTPQNSLQDPSTMEFNDPQNTVEPYTPERAEQLLDSVVQQLKDHTPESCVINVRATAIADEMNDDNLNSLNSVTNINNNDHSKNTVSDPQITKPEDIPSVADSTRPLHCINANEDYLVYEGHNLEQVSEHVTDDVIQCAIDTDGTESMINGTALQSDDGEFKVTSSSPTLTQSIQSFLNDQKSKAEAEKKEDPALTAARLRVAKKIVDKAMNAGVEKFLQQQTEDSSFNGRAVNLDESRSRDNVRPNSLSGVSKKRLTAPVDLLNNTLQSNSSASSLEDTADHHTSNELRKPHKVHDASDPEVDDILSTVADAHTPDDLNTPDIVRDFGGGLQLEATPSPYTAGSSPGDSLPEWGTKEEDEANKNWRTVTVSGKEHRIDLRVIEPYKKVLSHGGYYGDGHNAIVVFSGCYLPDKGRRDYNYVMDHLFLYVVNTLELLVVEDYMIVYFHGATPRNKMPGLRWLRRCYEMLDRKLKKNLKRLLIVHPTLWLKTIMIMTKPFISSKFKAKLKYVHNLAELSQHLPVEYVYIPDDVQTYDETRCGGAPKSESPKSTESNS